MAAYTYMQSFANISFVLYKMELDEDYDEGLYVLHSRNEKPELSETWHNSPIWKVGQKILK